MILLVSCYELGRPPLGLAQPAAFLRRAGLEVELLDLAVEPLDESRLARARFVGVSVPMHTALRMGLRVIERARAARPDGFLCAYGLYAALCEPILRAHGADAVLAGELEEQLTALARRVVAGEAGNAPAPTVLDRLAFPVPSREGLPALSRYARLLPGGGARDGDGAGAEERLAGAVEASRGCLHHCRHCPIPPVYHGRLFVVPRAAVLADVRRLVEQGARHITFADADFLNAPTHSMEIARALHAAHPDVTFDVTAKVEHLIRHRRLLPELGQLGCSFLVSAVESLSDRVLSLLDKGHTRGDVLTALALVEDAGIAFRPTFVPFTPWSTLEEYVELLRFVEDNALHDRVDPVQLSIRLLVPPGSLLLERPETRGAFGELDPRLLAHRWTHPDPRMDDLQRRVAALVEADARGGAPPRETFDRVRALAHHAGGGDAMPASAAAPRPRRRAPRLSEPWFC